jgi:hypothetical protein
VPRGLLMVLGLIAVVPACRRNSVPRVLLMVLGLIAVLGGGGYQAAAQNGSSDPAIFEIRRNPALVQSSRINQAETERIADQLAKIVKGPPLPRTRPAMDPVTQSEWQEINSNPLFSAAYEQDSRDTVLWLRKINAIIASKG